MSNETSTKSHDHPPKVPLVYRVGVVGHRPNRLANTNIDDLKSTLSTILSEVKKTIFEFYEKESRYFTNATPVFRAISPLAEGTDRIFAEQALQQEFELCCPMPFHQEEYEKDFEPNENSVDSFRQILLNAKENNNLTVFELNGSRENEQSMKEAYASAGNIVLNQSDILIAVWDKDDTDSKGGTYDTIRKAFSYNVPVLWIDAKEPTQYRFISKFKDVKNTQPEVFENLKETILESVQPPHLIQTHENETTCIDYFSESKPKWNFMVFWKVFRNCIGRKTFSCPDIHVANYEDQVDEDWSFEEAGTHGWINKALWPHYTWADKIADIYADAYRSAFILVYLFASMAVFFALLPFGLEPILSEYWHDAENLHAAEHVLESICITIECLIIITIIALVYKGRKKRWRERWMDYRIMAELIRQLRFLIILGGGRPFVNQPPHLNSYGDPERTWMFWHTQNLSRWIGLPNVRFDSTYVTEYLEYLKAVVIDQIKFHEKSVKTHGNIEHKLHSWGFWIFIITFICILFHLVFNHFAFGMYTFLVVWLTIGAAGLPALGAAFSGINNQGEFLRVSRRSRGMEEHLKHIRKDIEDLQNSEIDKESLVYTQKVITLALRTSNIMVDEVLDWRVVFSDRGIHPA
jgi:hypothetical protein